MKIGLRTIMGIGLMIISYGCIMEHRDDGYQMRHKEYREHEQEHRDSPSERGYDERRGPEEHRDYDERR